MPGAIPSGADPSGMTPHPFSIVGAMLSGLESRTEENVRAELESEVKTDPTLTNFSNKVFSGINPALGIVAGIIEAMLRKIIGSIPIIGPIADEWVGELLDQLEVFYTNLGGFLGSIDFTSPDFNPVEAVNQFVNLMLLPLNLLLGPNSPISSGQLFGQIPTNLFGIIPANTIGATNPNLLTNPAFDGSISVLGGTVWSWDDDDGRTTPGSVRTTANGTNKVLLSNGVNVLPGQVLSPSVWVKSSGYAGTGTPIKMSIRAYGTSPSTTDIESTAGPGSTWFELNGTYTVPEGVSQVKIRLSVGATATAGDIWFDDATLTRGGNGPFDGLLDLFGLGGLDDLLGGLDANTKWTQVIQDILNPLHVLEDFSARSLASSLDDALAELDTIFDGSPLENPVAAIANTVKGWWDTFFNGGPRNVVTQDLVAAESGIPPMDAETKIPWTYLPTDLMTVALGMPWVNCPKSGANQSITASTDTLLTSWGTQTGPTSLTFSSNKFTLPFDGMWFFEVTVKWSSATLTGPLTVNIKQNDVVIRESISYGEGVNALSFAFPAATTDVFGVYAQTAVGSMSVTTAGTWIRATYMGQTTVPSLPPPAPAVAFGTHGAGAHGNGTISWSHTFAADDKAVIIPISHENSGTPLVTISGGGPTVPVLSGPTYIGNYFGANARCSLAGMLLPPGIAGTTRTITVSWGGAGNAASANSLAFKNVVSLGSVKVNSGGGSPNPNIFVPSNVSSMVVCQFGGMDVNFSGFNRTQTDIWGFSAFDTWAHVIGYAVGGQSFSANGGRWAAKAIELSNH